GARYAGRPVHFTDFIVRADGPYKSLADTFGGRIAYSTEHSHSGYNAPRFHLLGYRTAARPTFYREVIGPFIRQMPCLDAVVDGRADVAAIDGYGFELLAKHPPEVAGRVRVVESTIAAPSAPLVAAPVIDAATRERLAAALLSAHEAAEIRSTLAELLLTRFVAVTPGDFQVFLDRERAAEVAGYPKLACMRTLVRGGWIVGFAGGGHALLRDGVVVFEDDRIVHVGPRFDGTVDREIDARDKLVCPGFIDTHVHSGHRASHRLITDTGRPDY